MDKFKIKEGLDLEGSEIINCKTLDDRFSPKINIGDGSKVITGFSWIPLKSQRKITIVCMSKDQTGDYQILFNGSASDSDFKDCQSLFTLGDDNVHYHNQRAVTGNRWEFLYDSGGNAPKSGTPIKIEILPIKLSENEIAFFLEAQFIREDGKACLIKGQVIRGNVKAKPCNDITITDDTGDNTIFWQSF